MYGLVSWYCEHLCFTNLACCIIIQKLHAYILGITFQQSQTLHEMVKIDDTKVTVCHGDDLYSDITTDQLVPGDVIVVPPNGCMMTCDAVLKSGTCIVNESMLTGTVYIDRSVCTRDCYYIVLPLMMRCDVIHTVYRENFTPVLFSACSPYDLRAN